MELLTEKMVRKEKKEQLGLPVQWDLPVLPEQLGLLVQWDLPARPELPGLLALLEQLVLQGLLELLEQPEQLGLLELLPPGLPSQIFLPTVASTL